MRSIISIFVLAFLAFNLSAQGVTIGDTNTAPHPSAALQIKSTKGFLLSKMTTTQRNQIQNPANGLQIYNTTTNCVQIRMPSGWRDLFCDCNQYPSSSFIAPNSIYINQTVSFTNADPGPTYSWSFQGGNPATSNQQNPIVSWPQAGSYQVILTVTNSLGCSSSDTQTVTVTNCSYNPGSQIFSYTGSMQTFTVPACITSVTIECWGAQGWSGSNPGGKGGYVTGQYVVTPGQQLFVYVGQAGQVASVAYSPMGGGWNGGGNGQCNSGGYTGGGGGGSDVRVGGQNLTNRIIVAGGGGGSTNNSTSQGGHGGGLTGQDGGQCQSYHYGKGGTQTQGGDSGGTLGQGGNALSWMTPWNGGGGGGYYGGGVSTAHSGGGGGSSYYGGVTNGSTQTGIRNGNGQITITW